LLYYTENFGIASFGTPTFGLPNVGLSTGNPIFIPVEQRSTVLRGLQYSMNSLVQRRSPDVAAQRFYIMRAASLQLNFIYIFALTTHAYN
jgi:hypothetical protein